MSPIRPPTMVRSRSQLGSAYAPHHPFTFEGGEGACMTVPWSGNRDARLKEITRRTIAEQIQEYCEAWAARATQGTGLRHPVDLTQAVDGSIISGGVVHVRSGDLVFQTPEAVGYVPSRWRSSAKAADCTGAVARLGRRNKNLRTSTPPAQTTGRVAQTTGNKLTL